MTAGGERVTERGSAGQLETGLVPELLIQRETGGEVDCVGERHRATDHLDNVTHGAVDEGVEPRALEVDLRCVEVLAHDTPEFALPQVNGPQRCPECGRGVELIGAPGMPGTGAECTAADECGWAGPENETDTSPTGPAPLPPW